ncbi:ruBisCO large subunit-binding protein subunit beta, chloroplastic [Gossypium australe]|uniref:RuBisCO large subunit-binding protein subunit beta, chloroplastic n=1 Tax=Gossypium australe TaxID=47621 RepID=A0A5B6VF96_9ROSI|nr:ruBisCO large subunit-binding protein subunit beta, chloroplastic [Gossypium australe]
MAQNAGVFPKSLKSYVQRLVKCCLEHAASVAKTFLMSDCVVVEKKNSSPCLLGTPWIIQDTATKANAEGELNKVSNLHRSNDEPV